MIHKDHEDEQAGEKEEGEKGSTSQPCSIRFDNSIKHLGDKNPLTTGAYFTVAQIYSKQNKFEQSLEKYNTILKKEFIAENNPNYPRLMQAFAEVYTKMNNLELAETYHIKALEALKNIFGEEHRMTKDAHSKYVEFLANKK